MAWAAVKLAGIGVRVKGIQIWSFLGNFTLDSGENELNWAKINEKEQT